MVVTNDPFDPEESRYWQENYPVDRRFFAALRLDCFLNKCARRPPPLYRVLAIGWTWR